MQSGLAQPNPPDGTSIRRITPCDYQNSKAFFLDDFARSCLEFYDNLLELR